MALCGKKKRVKVVRLAMWIERLAPASPGIRVAITAWFRNRTCCLSSSPRSTPILLRIYLTNSEDEFDRRA